MRRLFCHQFTRFTCVAALLVVPSLAYSQQRHSVAGWVTTLDSVPLAGVIAGIRGVGEGLTSGSGNFELPLTSGKGPGSPIALYVKEEGKSWLVVSPLLGSGFVPQPGNELRVVVSVKSDPQILKTDEIVEEIVAEVVSRLDPQRGAITEPDVSLTQLATGLGFQLGDLKSAIAEWLTKVEGPRQSGLAALYEEQYAKADSLLREPEAALKADLVEVLLARASANYALAHNAVAESLLVQARALRPEDSNVLNGLGHVLTAQGKYEEALPVYRRALAIRESALGPEHPDVVGLLSNLGHLLWAQGEYGAAEHLFRRGLAIAENSPGPEHLQVITLLSYLADLLAERGHYGEAETLRRRQLAIWESVLGPEHPGLATPLNILAELLRKQGKYSEAEPILRRALEKLENALGPEHPEVATSLYNLAELLRRLDRDEEAVGLEERAKRIRDRG